MLYFIFNVPFIEVFVEFYDPKVNIEIVTVYQVPDIRRRTNLRKNQR